jgi:small subunit ribosomal protein S19
MARSLKKGPYVDEKLLKKIQGKRPEAAGVIKTWARECTITPEMVGFSFGVHNGKQHTLVVPREEMVGHKLGEFSPTTKFVRHGGRMQKELESQAAEKAAVVPGAAPAAAPAGGAKPAAPGKEKK